MLQGEVGQALSKLNNALELLDKHRSNDLEQQIFVLYHLAWANCISGHIGVGLCFINRAINVVQNNDTSKSCDYLFATRDYFRHHFTRNSFIKDSWEGEQLLIARYNCKLTPEGFPNEYITVDVAILLDDVLTQVEMCL